ncbi:MAG: sigma-70 family RNA polymerase sigma factor [Pyrinomonadaceae bacterium]
MPVLQIERILRDLDSGDPEEAWTEFLRDYAAQTFQVIRYFESDPDRASDCFQFVCERLVEDRFRRLRKFKADGAAKFSTWLRAVVRNLCLDWRRKEFGRLRTFHSISRLSLFDQQVFRIIYERGGTTEECLHLLASRFPQVAADQVAESRLRIEDALKPEQRWLLARRVAKTTPATSNVNAPETAFPDIPDSQPNPEEQSILNESRSRLRTLMRGLSTRDQLLLRLRFEQELTLEQCAKLIGGGNAQRVDRQIKEILARLRNEMNL